MKYKIGDWVVCKDNILHQITEIKPDGMFYRDHICIGDQYNTKLWRPKKGDWVWFINKQYHQQVIGQCGYPGDQLHFGYDYMEPFIGNLPKFLKEQK